MLSASSYQLGREHTFRAKRWCIKWSMLCKAFPTSGTKSYFNYVFSTSTSWLYALGVGFMVFTIITWDYSNIRTLDQTVGAYTSWIWRTLFKQIVVWGGILKRLLPIIPRKHCCMAFFLCPPSKLIDPALPKLSCNKANVIDHCCPLLQASRLDKSIWLDNDYSPTCIFLEIRGFPPTKLNTVYLGWGCVLL